MLAAGASADDETPFDAGPLTLRKIAIMAVSVLAISLVSWRFGVLGTVFSTTGLLGCLLLLLFGALIEV